MMIHHTITLAFAVLEKREIHRLEKRHEGQNTTEMYLHISQIDYMGTLENA